VLISEILVFFINETAKPRADRSAKGLQVSQGLTGQPRADRSTKG